MIHLQNRASKGKTGGRSIPMHADLAAASSPCRQTRGRGGTPSAGDLFRTRAGMSAASVQLWFHRLYSTLELGGCSSHSGRRTFITRAARKVSEAGGSLRDVQQLAGHTSLAMTQRYIEGDTDAKRKLIALI